MILGDHDIVRRMEYATEERQISFGPKIDPEQIQPASVDLRLGGEFECPFTGTTWFTSGTYTLEPYECVLAGTAESVTLPDDVAAQATGRSTLGRKFVIVHATAGWLDPGWEGNVTLEIANLTHEPVELPIGERVAQIVLFETKSKTSGYEGQYAGDGVESAGEL